MLKLNKIIVKKLKNKKWEINILDKNNVKQLSKIVHDYNDAINEADQFGRLYQLKVYINH